LWWTLSTCGLPVRHEFWWPSTAAQASLLTASPSPVVRGLGCGASLLPYIALCDQHSAGAAGAACAATAAAGRLADVGHQPKGPEAVWPRRWYANGRVGDTVKYSLTSRMASTCPRRFVRANGGCLGRDTVARPLGGHTVAQCRRRLVGGLHCARRAVDVGAVPADGHDTCLHRTPVRLLQRACLPSANRGTAAHPGPAFANHQLSPASTTGGLLSQSSSPWTLTSPLVAVPAVASSPMRPAAGSATSPSSQTRTGMMQRTPMGSLPGRRALRDGSGALIVRKGCVVASLAECVQLRCASRPPTLTRSWCSVWSDRTRRRRAPPSARPA